MSALFVVHFSNLNSIVHANNINYKFYEFHNHPGGSVLAAFTDSFAPLYFTVRQLKEVMSTEQPCDLAYEFGDGLYDIKELPLGFPRPGRGLFIFLLR